MASASSSSTAPTAAAAAGGWKPIAASTKSMRTSNPIRKIVDQLNIASNPAKERISLSIGDPTVYGMRTAPSVEAAVRTHLESGAANGYPHSCGYAEARAAVAAAHSVPTAPLTGEDVVLCSGCSGAIEICITALANEGQNILVPRPGFSLYQTICESNGIECRWYNLKPEAGWEIDLDHMASLVDDKTAAILVNNPSNPCGSVYSRAHLEALLARVEQLRVPVIADEIYADMVFEGQAFTPLASVPSAVPMLAVGGLAKRFLVPGWRLGWILIHDRGGALAEVRRGVVALTTLILGANSLVQATLPTILRDTPPAFFADTMRQLQRNSELLHRGLDGAACLGALSPIMPAGAMYLMVGINFARFLDSPDAATGEPAITDDIIFSRRLLQEESVFVLPGQVFKMPGYVRLVTCANETVLAQACERIAAFCKRHTKPE